MNGCVYVRVNGKQSMAETRLNAMERLDLTMNRIEHLGSNLHLGMSLPLRRGAMQTGAKRLESLQGAGEMDPKQLFVLARNAQLLAHGSQLRFEVGRVTNDGIDAIRQIFQSRLVVVHVSVKCNSYSRAATC